MTSEGRWKAMWDDLEDRIMSAQGAPLPEERRTVLDWVEGEMIDVWNRHRDDEEPEDGRRPA